LYKSIALETHGNVFIAEEPTTTGTQAHVLEFGPNATGRAKQLRDVVVTCPAGNTVAPDVENLRIDTSGNLYAELWCSETSQTIIMYPPKSTTPQTPIGGIATLGFTLDGHGDVVAVVAVGSHLTIQVFAPNSDKPVAVIAGPITGLNAKSVLPVGIAAPP
jgi:hypothetical protein